MSTGPEELSLETIAPEDADLIDLRYEGVDLPLDENADPTQVDLACGEHLGVVSLEGGYDDESFVDLHVLGEVFRGESAYATAVRNGFVGTEAQWLETLVGPESPNAAVALAAQLAAEQAADRAEAANLNSSESETTAAGHASAANTARTQAQAYSDAAGLHAQASLDFQTQAETSAGQALAYRNQAAQSSTDADSAATRAETAEGVSVTMRNQAQGFSEASAASSQSAETYMDESRVEAQAARDAHLLAETSRENSLAHSQASYDSAQEALARSTEAGEYASAALTSRLAAEAARDDTDVAAAAVIIDRDIVIARADEAGEYAEAAESHRASALTSAGAASVSASNSAISETNADSSRVAAEAARDIAVASSGDAADALAATISYRDQAEIFSDQSGDYATAAASSATSASTSSAAAGTSATGAGASAAAALANANASASSASSALTQAGAALTSANNAATSATTSTNQATNSATSATAAAASQAAAALSESAAILAEADAIIAQGAAQTAATNAATQATAAALSATNALSSANSAATSATQSSNSETTAAGHASNASISAGAAATSATNAQNSSTAAAGSASTASTHATNAGNSATSAAASSVSAASSFTNANLAAAMQFPDRYDGTTGAYFAGFPLGSPSTILPKPSNATQAGYGPVCDITGEGGADDFATVGVLPATPGRIYKAEVEFQRTASTGTPDINTTLGLVFRTMEADFSTDTGYMGEARTALTGSVQTLSYMVSDTVSGPGIYNWPAGTIWLRPYARQYFGSLTAQTIRIRRLTVTDVTEQQAALTSANAAATSASAASTSAGSAGTSATAANTSATNAATSAGSASTFATNASNSATTATTAANTASTQAGLASTSATNASNSATAAGTSATTAATHATNAGNSASAASTSAINAASSFSGAAGATSSALPSDFSQDGLFWTSNIGAGVGSSAPAPNGSFVTVAGVGRVYQSASGYSLSNIMPRSPIPLIAGQKWRFRTRVRYTTLPSSGGIFIYLRCLNESLVYTVGVGPTTTTANVTGTEWTDLEATYTVPATPPAAYFRPEIRGGNGDGSGQYQASFFEIVNITQSDAAAASATAAATSASNASTSATAAGTSATSANTSANTATTQAGSASTSATNAANSATTATTQANNASTSASTAATQASNAAGSASAAGTSATTAGTHATNAGNSATAANTSAVNAASSYTNTLLVGGNQFFEQGLDGWSGVDGGSVGSKGGRSNVYSKAGAITHFVQGLKKFPIDFGRKYKITGAYWTGAGSDPSRVYIGFRAYDANGAALTHSPGGYAYVAALGILQAANAGWVEYKSGVLVPQATSPTTYGYPPGTASISLIGLLNYNSSTTDWGLDFVRLDDVTEAEDAAISATAASTSAVAASTSATAAGTSATAASTSATNAATSASSAGTFATNSSNSATGAAGSATDAASSATTAGTHATTAGNAATTATTQASNASSSAASASSSAAISAAVGLGSMNQNPVFSDWPVQTGETPPTGWTEYTGANGVLSRVAGLNGSPNAVRTASGSTGNFGISNASPYTLGASPGGEYVVIEGDFTLISGDLTGSGIYAEGRTASAGVSAASKSFATLADASGVIRGAGVAGSTYRYRFLCDLRGTNVDRYIIYGMARWSVFNPVGAATLDWHRLSIRAATQEEIAAGVALPALSATVSAQSAVLTDLENNYELARYEVAADTGGGTARLRLVSSTYGTNVLLDADKIFFGDNTVFDNAVDVLVTTNGAVQRIIALGAPFGTDGTLTEWEGDSSVTWGNHSRTNAYYYRANAAPYSGGSRRLVRTDLVETDAITKEYRSDSVSTNNYNTVGPMTARTTVHYITIPTTGKKISFNAQFLLQAHHTQDDYTFYVVVERLLNGVTTDVFTSNIQCLTTNGDGYIHGWQMINFTDIPAANASVQYSIRVYHTFGIGGPGNFTDYIVSHKSISIREHRTE